MNEQIESSKGPQIQAMEGITGQPSLKASTEGKMCHVGTVQKRQAYRIDIIDKGGICSHKYVDRRSIPC